MGDENSRLEGQAWNSLVPELFMDGGRLSYLYGIIAGTGLHQSAQLQRAFHTSQFLSREGIVLTYIAQAIHNAIQEFVLHDAKPVVVVATIAVTYQGPVFVVGLNGHDNVTNEIPAMRQQVPNDIMGVPVVVIADQLPPHQGAIHKRVGDVSAWSWHGEQKVLRYIKQELGPNVRSSVVSIGIAHIRGPCHEGTAGKGTNYCYLYLSTKHEKDLEQVVSRGYTVRSVEACWYANAEAASGPSGASLTKLP